LKTTVENNDVKPLTLKDVPDSDDDTLMGAAREAVDHAKDKRQRLANNTIQPIVSVGKKVGSLFSESSIAVSDGQQKNTDELEMTK
jgi:hypothetical protein